MNWFGKQRREAAEEIQSHIAERIDELIESGMPEQEAGRQALREFGNPVLLTESSREVWGWLWLDRLRQDLSYALRMMRRNPGFTTAAVLSLALGIGANTAIFTLIESTLLRPIPVKHPERLRLLAWQNLPGRWVPAAVNSLSPTYGWYYERVTPDGGLIHTSFAPPFFQELQRGNTVFESLFAFKEAGRITAVVDGNAEPVNCFLVSGSFYRGMEVSPVIGRAIGPQNDVRTAASSVVLISYEYWTRRFGRNPSVIGKTITLNRVPVTIIGVNPAYFTGIEPGANFEIWAPLSIQSAVYGYPLLDDVKVWSLPIMGRLKRGVSDAQAQSALAIVLQREMAADYPALTAAERPRLLIQSGARGMDYLTDHYVEPLLALLSLAGLVLLIACANVANLMLAKSAVRQREISLRLALGAGRRRIVRQLLTEGLLLASLAGVAGGLLGYLVRNSIPAMLASSWRPSPFEAAFDPRVLLISLGITFLTGVLFSLAPVWQSRRVAVNEALKEGSRATAGLSKLRAGKLLVVLQIALSLLLLVGAGLFVKTFTNLKSSPIGINPEGIVLFGLDPPTLRYPADRLPPFFAQLRERTAAIPGVESATFSAQTLLSHGIWRSQVTPAGQRWDGKIASMASDIQVGSHFFETMGIPILYGRAVDDRDTPRAAVVTLEFGRHFFHEDNPTGRTFTINSGHGPFRIVGVCADARYNFPGAPATQTLFRYFGDAPRVRSVTFEVKIAGQRGGANAAGTIKQIRQVVRSFDPDLAMTDLRTQTEQIENTISQERLLAALASVFGLLALILACIGIYGVMAYAVARRTNEIGIRVALGAQPGRVLWMVLRETLLLAAVGIAIGVPCALVLSRFAKSFLYGLTPNDPFVISAAVLALAAAGCIAGYFPARRASHVDPVTALRHD